MAYLKLFAMMFRAIHWSMKSRRKQLSDEGFE